MVKNITIFATIFLIFALIFSFVAVKVVRTYDISNVAKQGFNILSPSESEAAIKERIDSEIGYSEVSDADNPLVISAVLGTYPEDDQIIEEVKEESKVITPPVVEVVPQPIEEIPPQPIEEVVPQPIEEIPPQPILTAPINNTLSAELIIEKAPQEDGPVDRTKTIREVLSQEKAESRLNDLIQEIETKADPKVPTMAGDTDSTYVYMTSNDMIIAYDALRQAALRSIYPIIKSDISSEFVWKDMMENN